MPILTDDERIGQVVGGGYRLDRILGRGGMGVVYAATHTRVPQLRAAVKFLNATYAQNAEVVARFMREAQAAAMLKHPNVVTVMDVGTSAGAPYMLLEFLDGKSLSDLLAERGALSPQEMMKYLGPVMSAVAFAHDLGVVHRDIKPDNIFLSRLGQGELLPKVLDFGIAKLMREQSLTYRTATGGILGTPTYMAPEQAQGQGVGPWSDVWSMGIVMFEALSGTLPWDLSGRSDVMHVLSMVLTEAPVSLRARRPGLPTPIIEVVDQALHRDPAQRFPNMRALDEAMRAAIGRVSQSDTLQPGQVSHAIAPAALAPTVPMPAPRRPIALLAASVLGLGALVGAGGYAVLLLASAHPAPAPAPNALLPPPAPSTVVPASAVAVATDAGALLAAPSDTHHTHHHHASTDLPSTTAPVTSPPTTRHETTDPPTVGRSGGLIPIDDP